MSNGFWVGVDPGGAKAFGVALIFPSGEIRTNCVSYADEAVELIASCPDGVGVDAPLWWSSGQSADRYADQWIRKTHGIPSGTVQAANSLRGAAIVQGAMFVARLREKFPSVRVTETHPKAIAKALGGWEGEYLSKLLGNSHRTDHERDALFAAISAREGFEGRWPIDLSIKRLKSEQDPKTYWLGPVSYFWPEIPDAETRFRLRSARGDKARGLDILDQLDRYHT